MHAFEIIYGINHQSVYRLPAIQYGHDGKQMRSGGSIFAVVSTSSSQTVLPLLHKRNFLSHHAYNSYTRLTKLTSPSQNYKEYRKAIAEIQEAELQRLPGDKNPRFHVPYLGILLKDLVGMEEAGKPLAGLSSMHPNQLAALHHSVSNADSRLAELDDPASAATNVYQVDEADENDAAEGSEEDDDDGDENSVVLGDSVPVGSSMIEEEDDAFLERDSRTSLSSTSNTNSMSTATEENRDPNSSNGDTLNFVTGSLPWDDSFLARPRRNARVDDELDLFSIQSSSSTHSSSSTPSESKSNLKASLSPSEDKKADLLTMLLTVDEAAFEPSPIKIAATNSPVVSLLSAALPTRHTKSRPSSKRSSRIQSSSSQDLMGSKRTSRIVAGGGGEASHRVLNRPKLCKIASIVETALRCRFSFPALPNEEDDDVLVGDKSQKKKSSSGAAPTSPTRSRGLTAAFAKRATEQAEEQKQFMHVVAAAALDTPALVDPSLSSSGSEVTPVAPPASSSLSELAFDRRVQHWLLSNMMTVTLKEEQQLMEKSYVIYPRKIPGSNNL